MNEREREREATSSDALSPRKSGSELLGRLLHVISFGYQKPFDTGIVAELLLPQQKQQQDITVLSVRSRRKRKEEDH